MLSVPPVQIHISQRWWGDLMTPSSTARASSSGAARLPFDLFHRAVPLRRPRRRRVVNLLLIPPIAVFPPLEGWITHRLERLGKMGKDPRRARRRRPPPGLRSPPTARWTSGYSPTLGLWWNAVFLINEPWFKFYTAMASSIFLFGTLLYTAPCFDITEDAGCFSRLGPRRARRRPPLLA